jgi:hypothetical protein
MGAAWERHGMCGLALNVLQWEASGGGDTFVTLLCLNSVKQISLWAGWHWDGSGLTEARQWIEASTTGCTVAAV